MKKKATANRQQATRNILSWWLLTAACCLLPVASLYAGGPGTTSGELLKIPVSARAIGMGEAYTAESNDYGAMSWNPAGMASLKQKEAAFMHTELVGGIRYEHAACVLPSQNYALGASASYLSYGDIDGYDRNGLPTGQVKANAYNLQAGLATEFLQNYSAGVTMGYIRENLAQISAQTYAVNAGGLYQLPVHPWQGEYRLGASVQNMGPGLKFISERDPLPQKIRFGAAASQIRGLPLTVTADVTRPNDNSTFVSAGFEYVISRMLALRTGYVNSNTLDKGIRLGLGLRALGCLFDYAYGSMGDFGAIHRFSLSLRFGPVLEKPNAVERAAIQQAKSLMNKGYYDLAVLELEKGLQIYPNSTLLMTQLVKTHEEKLKADLATVKRQPTDAIQEEPLSPDTYALSPSLMADSADDNLIYLLNLQDDRKAVFVSTSTYKQTPH